MNKKPWAICGLLPVLLWIAGGLLVPAFAQVTYQSSSAAIGADGTSRTITIPLPAGTTAGNLLIASMSVRWYQATVTAPGGWTLLLDSQQSQGAVTCGSGSTAGIRTLTYYKTAVAGETAPTFGYSSTCSDTGFAAAGMLRISGADPTTPIITSAQTIGGSSTTSHSAPSISSGSETNTLLVTVHAYGSSYSWSTAPTGMVERIDQRSYGADNALGSTLGVFTQFSAAVWTTGTKTAVGAGGADYGLGQSILIRSVRPTVTASTGASVNEGNSDTTTLSFPISLSQAAVGAITLPYSLGGGTATGGASCTTAGVDYINTASSITIAAGATSGTINVTLCGDTTYEANETFTLTLGTPVNAVLGSPSAATGTIINDDSPPTLTISNSSLSEGNTTGASTNMNFTVTLSAASGLPTTVNYATSAGTATTGTTCVGNTDFLTTSGTLTINAGATTGTIVIPICGDTTIEADETLTLTLSSPTNATLGTPSSATGTILNDDSNIVITCVTKNPSSCSNNTSIGSRAWSNPTNAYTSNNSYASADSGNRDRQTNYLYCTGYNFAVPSGSSLLSIELGAERYASNANRFSDNSIRLIKGGVIQAFNAVNTGYYPTIDNNTSDWHSFSETGGWTVAEINAPNFGGAFSAIGRNFVYVDHLPIKVCYGTSITPLVSIAASAPIYEGNTGTINLNFNVTLNAASASSTTVQYTIGGGGGDTAVGSGTCSGTTDFINIGGTLTFDAGQTSKTIPVPICVDTAYEPDETFTVTLTNPVGLALSPQRSAIGTILNDDSAGGFIISVADFKAGAGVTGTIQAPAGLSMFQDDMRAIKFYYVATAGGTSGTMKMDAWEGATNETASVGTVAGSQASAIEVDVYFDANGIGRFDLNYDNVGALTLYAYWDPSLEDSRPPDSPPSIIGNDPFVVSPYRFDLDANVSESSGGSSFSVAVTAQAICPASAWGYGCAAGTYTKATNFTGAAASDVTLSMQVADPFPLDGNNPNNPNLWCSPVPSNVSCSSTSAASPLTVQAGAFANGSYTLDGARWSDVGLATLTATSNYLGSGAASNPGESILFFPIRFRATYHDPDADPASWPAYGVATPAGPATAAAPYPFIYLGQPGISLSQVIVAEVDGPNSTPVTASNYRPSIYTGTLATVQFSPRNSADSSAVLVYNDDDFSDPPINSAVPSCTWDSGVCTVVSPTTSAALNRNAPTPPANPPAPVVVEFIVTITDSEGKVAQCIGDPPSVPAPTLPTCAGPVGKVFTANYGRIEARYGRLRLINTYGSELLDSRVEVRAEYWDGSRWTTNTLDKATTLNSNSVFVSNAGTLAPTVKSITQFSSGGGGVGFITFYKTSAAGSFDIAYNLNASGNDTSCNAAHGGTAANWPWLKGLWAAPANCGGVAAWAQDPNARIRLGSPKAPYIYLRERY